MDVAKGVFAANKVGVFLNISMRRQTIGDAMKPR